MNHLSSPLQFLPTPGEPSMPWKDWIPQFDNFLSAIDGDGYNTARKKALLLHCLGPEGQRIFKNLPDIPADDPDITAQTTDYVKARIILDRHFGPKTNVVADRYKFRQRAQQSGESIDAYIAALRALAASCKFMAPDEMIRDQIVEKIQNDNARQRLLMEPDLTLSKAIQIVRRVETAVRDARALKTTTASPQSFTSDVHTVSRGGQNVSRGGHNFSRGGHNSKRHETRKQYNRDHDGKPPWKQEKIQCFRCGSPQHKANFPQCPAKDKKCGKCQKMGHFSKICKSETIREVSTTENFDYDAMQILALTDAKNHAKGVYCDITINDAITLNMCVDTAADRSLLNYQTFTKYFTPHALEESGESLMSYTGTPIPVRGLFKAKVRYRDNTTVVPFLVVDKGRCLLGKDAIRVLAINIQGDTLTCCAVEDIAENPDSIKPLPIINGFMHRIKVNPNIPPIHQKLRRLPFAVRPKVSALLQQLEAQDVIEKVDASDWVSPIVVAYKKNGDIRLCVDLREVNKAIVPDRYPLPKIPELLCELKGAKVFSKLDLQAAYHQLQLHSDSRDLTTFITHDGLYRYKRVCFGLSSAPSAFQKLMATVLTGLPGVQCYLDDVIVYGSSTAEHDANLHAVQQRLRKYNVQLNLPKCIFRQNKLLFLGHVITPEGIQIDDSQVRAITDAPAPKDATALKSFLGLAGYFSMHVRSFADVTKPMRDVLHSPEFYWTAKAEQSFKRVKSAIQKAPVLSIFNPDLRTFVTCDASSYGLGAVLSQIDQNGVEKIITCISRTLTKPEMNYSVGEKEALACKYACEKWHVFLWGREFTLRTDHRALSTLLTKGSNRQSMRIARWAYVLMQYNYKVEYTPGSENKIADALSRLPCSVQTENTVDDTDIICHVMLSDYITDQCISLAEIQQATKTSTCSKIMDYVTKGWPAKDKLDADCLRYFAVRDEYSCCNGLLMRSDRIVVPDSLTTRIINIAHEAHQGITRTKQRLRLLYWWPNMDTQVENLIQNCVVCLANDKTVRPSHAPLQPVEYPEKAWHKLGLDIVGPIENAPPSSRFMISLIDYHSKWPEVCIAPAVTTATVVNFLSQVFSREGYPSEIVTDHGSQFTSRDFQSFLNARDIKHVYSSAYYPAANGAVERFNSVIKNAIQNAFFQKQSIKHAILQILTVYRATPHATTGETPSVLLHGRGIRTMLDVKGVHEGDKRPDPIVVREKVLKAQADYKRNADNRRRVEAAHLKPGDYVRIRKPYKVSKGTPQFTEPLKIVKVIRQGTYLTEDGKIWNQSKLSKCNIKPGYVNQSLPYILDDVAFGEPPQAQENLAGQMPRRPVRDRRPPLWLRDYQT